MGKRLEKTAAFFDIPAEALPDIPKLIITGSHRIVIENYSKIRSFSPERIEIACGGQSLCLRGDAFELERLTASELHIRGRVLLAELD